MLLNLTETNHKREKLFTHHVIWRQKLSKVYAVFEFISVNTLSILKRSFILTNVTTLVNFFPSILLHSLGCTKGDFSELRIRVPRDAFGQQSSSALRGLANPFCHND